MRIDIWIKWELDTIRYFMDVLLPQLDDCTKQALTEGDTGFGNDGSLSKQNLALGARQIVLKAVLYELNALTEYLLLAFANRALPPGESLTPEAMRRSRSVLVRTIEQFYEIQLSGLPGYQMIDELRETVNALKHRGGLGLPEPGPMGIPVLTNPEISQEKVELYLRATRDFLLSLWQIVGSDVDYQ